MTTKSEETTPKMNPEIKELWLDRLESGKEKQGHGALKKVYPTKKGKVRKVRHCCLGVLCEIAREQGIVSESEVNLLDRDIYEQEDGINVVFGDDNSEAYLPDAVADWAGITRYSYPGDGGTQFELADLNDESSSFKKVIKYIKENL